MADLTELTVLPGDETKSGEDEQPLTPPWSVTNTEVPPAPTISLERVLLDAYEFHGLKELGFYFCFFALFVIFVWFQWSNRGAEFRSSIVESMRSYDNGNNWEISDLKQVESMKDAVQHITGYLDHYINLTLESEEPTNEGVVVIGDYAEVQLATLIVEMPTPHCVPRHTQRAIDCKTAINAARCNSTTREIKYLQAIDFLSQSNRWRKLQGRGNNYTWQSVIVSRMEEDAEEYGLKVNTSSYAQRVTDIIEEDSSIIATYATSIMLRMLLTSELGADVVLVELKLKLNKMILNKGLKATLLMLTVTVEQKWWLVVVGGATLLMCLHLLRRELRTWWLCKYQGESYWLYFKFGWNWISLLTLMSTLMFLLGHMVKYSIPQNRNVCKDWLDTKVEDILKLRGQARVYTLYLYGGIAIIGCQGFAMVRYMRVHAGLKAFYQVFVLAFDICKDFFVFVLYMFLVLGLLVFGMFQISGGNKLFVDYGTGLAAMARLQFQLLDFEEFTNLGLGFGRWSAFINFLFWASIVLLVVFVANILLAIFQFAYDKVKQRAVTVEFSFPYLVILRVIFVIRQILFFVTCMWKNCSPSAASRTLRFRDSRLLDLQWRDRWLDHLMTKYRKDNADKCERDPTAKTLLWARWIVARQRTLYALTTLYTSYKDLRLIGPTDSPIWLEKDLGLPLPSYSRVSGLRMSIAGSLFSVLAEEGASQQDESELPCRNERISRTRLLYLLKYLERFSSNVQPRNRFVQFLMSWHIQKTTTEQQDALANQIMRVYQYTAEPSRGGDDEDILNEESQDPTEKLLLEIRAMFIELDTKFSSSLREVERKIEHQSQMGQQGTSHA